ESGRGDVAAGVDGRVPQRILTRSAVAGRRGGDHGWRPAADPLLSCGRLSNPPGHPRRRLARLRGARQSRLRQIPDMSIMSIVRTRFSLLVAVGAAALSTTATGHAQTGYRPTAANLA